MKGWLVRMLAACVPVACLGSVNSASEKPPPGEPRQARGVEDLATSADATPESQPLGGDERAGHVQAPPDGAAAADSARRFLQRLDSDDKLRAAIDAAIRQHPDQARWSGRTGEHLFGITVRRLPTGGSRARATPLVLSAARSQATHELLTAKSLLDRYAAEGLTNSNTLRQALVEASGRLRVEGSAKGVVSQSAVAGEFAVGYAVAEERGLTAALLEPTAVREVSVAYRDVTHREARRLMELEQWPDAVSLWRHLHELGLVSQSLYVDAAHCFHELGQHEDGVRVLTEAVRTFELSASAEFFERAGDLAIEINGPVAQALAERAYEMASQKLTDPGGSAPGRKRPSDERGLEFR